MARLNSRVLLPAVTSGLGLFWLIYGLTRYGWWGDSGPRSGFFPAIIGSILFVVSILALVGGLKSESPRYLGAGFHPFFAAVAVVSAALIIGLFPALTVFILMWIKFYEKYGWFKTLVTTGITIALFYGIFSLWLQVPFPEGVILDAFRG